MAEKVVYIDDGENADWIKTPENRESEAEFHKELAKKLKGKKGEEPAPTLGVDGRSGPAVDKKART